MKRSFKVLVPLVLALLLLVVSAMIQADDDLVNWVQIPAHAVLGAAIVLVGFSALALRSSVKADEAE